MVYLPNIRLMHGMSLCKINVDVIVENQMSHIALTSKRYIFDIWKFKLNALYVSHEYIIYHHKDYLITTPSYYIYDLG